MTALWQILKKCKEEGLFQNYSAEHFIFPALDGGRPTRMCLKKNSWIGGVLENYDTFIANFQKMLYYVQNAFTSESFQILIEDYLSCAEGYSDFKFFERYGYVLIVCGIATFSDTSMKKEVVKYNNSVFFHFSYDDGSVYRFYCSALNQDQYLEEIKGHRASMELEFPLPEEDIRRCGTLAERHDIHFISPHIREVIDGLGGVKTLPENPEARNICLFQMISEEEEELPLDPICGVLQNDTMGFFRQGILADEYGYDQEISENVSACIVYRAKALFFLLGEFRYVLGEADSRLLFNEIQSKVTEEAVRKICYPFVDRAKLYEKIIMYGFASRELLERGQGIALSMLNKHRYRQSAVFSDQECIFLKYFIEQTIEKYPELLQTFGVNRQDGVKGIFAGYEAMMSVVRAKYPQGHPFLRKNFLLDGTAFSLAYCRYIVPKYLGNSEMMTDLLERKLLSHKDGHFNTKLFNEGFSEFEIFFYLFVGIFIKSRRYDMDGFLRLEYEPDGNQNKHFEYAFVFKDYKIKVEVKALECDPEYADGINLTQMKHGTLFYKNYFPALKEEDVVPESIRKSARKLKSNYRQVSKNVKKINEKCTEDAKTIHLGFLMINYGTSREEFISYLMHPEHGYLIRNPLDKMDALVLFSMCVDTDLLMEEILRQEHILVFSNEKMDNRALFEDLRLNHCTATGERKKYAEEPSETYGVYKGYNKDGIVHIQRADVFEQDWERAKNVLKLGDRLAAVFEELM